jgi:hypothetical protein
MGREFFLLFAMVACAISALIFLAHRNRGLVDIRLRRLEALTDALRDPGLDPATRAELLRTLAREHNGGLGRWLFAQLQRRELWRGLWFGAGWLLFVIGALLSLASVFYLVEISRDRGPLFAMSAIGFAMITLPLGLREVFRRDGAAQTR